MPAAQQGTKCTPGTVCRIWECSILTPDVTESVAAHAFLLDMQWPMWRTRRAESLHWENTLMVLLRAKRQNHYRNFMRFVEYHLSYYHWQSKCSIRIYARINYNFIRTLKCMHITVKTLKLGQSEKELEMTECMWTFNMEKFFECRICRWAILIADRLH